MKNKIVILSFLTLLLVPFLALAQDTFTGQKIDLSEHSTIFEKFTTPDVYQIDIRRIKTALESPENDSRINLKFGTTHDWDLELYPATLRSLDYRVRVLTANGLEEHRDDATKTYYGYLVDRPNSEVRVTIKDDFFYGFVRDGDQTVYFEPANRFQENLSEEVILYRPDQVIQETMTCAHTEKVKKQNSNSNPSLTASGDCWELDLAIASDYSYYQDRGSDVSAVTAYTLGVMNNVATNYQLSGSTNFSDGIEFLIVENFVVTIPNGDPWTASTDPFALLPSFRDWASGSTGFSATHDLGQLWTNRDFDGSTVGLAYTSTNVICSNSRYHILEDYTTNAAQLRVLTAHEIGHNFGAEHDASNSGFIMAPSVNITNTWSTASKNSADQAIVNASIGNGACLVPCSTGPPTSNFTASTTVGCTGTAITFFDSSVNGTSNWNWSFPGGNPSSSNLQNPTVVYPSTGSYDVTLTAGNGSGNGTTETKIDFINIVQNPTNACVPGGSLGNGGVRFFSLGTISNTSGNAITDGNTYLDNSCLQVANLTPGETYQGVVNVGDFNTSTFEAVRIYLDYNNDGDFLDVDELIVTSGGQRFAGGNRTFNYTAPEIPLVSGVILRLRVVANESISNACQNMSTGQAEDYGIVFPGVAPLPVTLTGYEAVPKNKTSLLNWVTESEFNNDYYTLEHSTDGRNFSFLDEMNGQGTTSEITKYQYVHKNPIIGDNYYRLTQTDFDGTQEILGTRVVNFKTDETIVNIRPNPINEQTLQTAYISPIDGLLVMTIMGVDGKTIRETKQEILAGTTMLTLPLPRLSNGIYFLRTVLGETVNTTRFVKTN